MMINLAMRYLNMPLKYYFYLLLLCVVWAFVSGCAQSKSGLTADEYLRLGDTQSSRNRQQKAREYYQELLTHFPESHHRAVAQFNIAESLYRDKEYLEARFEYEKFLELHPAHGLAGQAQYQIGLCHVQQMRHYDRDQQHTRAALQAFRTMRRQHPQNPLIPDAEDHIRRLRQRLAAHEMSVARFYYHKRAYHAAIGRLLYLVQAYPQTSDLDEALFLLGTSYRAEENFIKAQQVFRTLVDRFPTSSYISRSRAQLRQLPDTGIVLE
jgi:outer membrane protein assembly factor BamD